MCGASDHDMNQPFSNMSVMFELLRLLILTSEHVDWCGQNAHVNQAESAAGLNSSASKSKWVKFYLCSQRASWEDVNTWKQKVTKQKDEFLAEIPESTDPWSHDLRELLGTYGWETLQV